MFYKTGSKLFVKSPYIRAYPCGRRRANLNNTYVPFDPEARLNTEFNNRRIVSKNGFTQSYTELPKSLFPTDRAEDNIITIDLSIAGYSFFLSLPVGNKINSTTDPEHFLGSTIVTELLDATELSDVASIYANILLMDTPLYNASYQSQVLASQDGEIGDAFLDKLVPSNNTTTSINADEPTNFYFSGLSFTGAAQTDENYFSLKLFEKKDDTWKIYQPSLLPKITHGTEPDSVDIEVLNTDTINVSNSLSCKQVPVVSAKLDEETGDDGNKTYKLKIYFYIN